MVEGGLGADCKRKKRWAKRWLKMLHDWVGGWRVGSVVAHNLLPCLSPAPGSLQAWAVSARTVYLGITNRSLVAS